ncbi:MAG: exodeoxyribonuclease III [Treponema sp.]|jgi:exodeoxyribonuclease-3|nr:exodeoxyribonuclease III [Treponema sp.]
MMRVLSWNVNGIRAVEKRGFVPWFQAEAPDILCLQETKARPDQLSVELREPRTKQGETYHAYWASAKKPGYSGVAIFSRVKPKSVKPLGIDQFDDEGRVLAAEFADFTLICAYFPNSQDGGARLPYKLDFCGAMMNLCGDLVRRKCHFILCGDYNIAHTPIDLARPRENEGNAGYLPEERAWMDSFTAAGHVDSFRHFHPGEAGHYSWWSYRAAARLRNVGWRIDYHCVDNAFLDRVTAARIRPEVEGSDHCPVEIELAER